jgi:FtsZ-interacting cell division protein ZipA
MSALRWWLLILGVVFFTALTVWELRRPRQARRGDVSPEPTRARDPTLQLPEMHARESLTHRALPVVELPEDADELPERADELPVLEAAAPESAGAQATAPQSDPAEPGWDEEPGEASFEVSTESESAPAAETDATAAITDTGAAPEPRVDWPPNAERRVVALRLVAPQPERFAGRSLRQALAAEGFVL